MRKFLLTIGFLSLIAILFYACKKDPIEIPVSSDDYIITNGRLAFSSAESYEKFLDGPENSSDNSNSKLAFETIKKGSSDTLIEDEFLASILNEKNIIQIGKNAYKLDFAEEKVYVLREVNDENIILLENKDVSSGKLVVYSMDDDVLEEEVEVESIALKKCKEGGARRCKDKITLNTSDEIGVTANADGSVTITTLKSSFVGKLVYQKAGIYFSIQSKLTWDSDETKLTIKVDGSTSSEIKHKNNQKFHGSATANGKYKIKCKAEHTVAASLAPNCYNKMKLDDQSAPSGRIFRGSKALNKYCVEASYKFNTENCSVSTNAEMILKIGDGYSDCIVCP